MEFLNDSRNRLHNWVSGSIRRKLTFFVVSVCVMLIVLFWVFGVQLLEPAYNASIRAELVRTVDVFATSLNAAGADGVALVGEYETSVGTARGLSQECVDYLNENLTTAHVRTDNLCIEIFDSDYRTVFLQDNLPSQCILHRSNTVLGQPVWQTSEALHTLQAEALTDGTVSYQTQSQMVMGRTVASGSMGILISANLESVPQAVSVLRKLMFFISMLLIVIAMCAAYIFSYWFTRPLTKLSTAAKELGKGNYDVRLKEVGNDEITDLMHDFNYMAREVKRSSELQRDILANVSHDLRTPLTLIKGYAETVRDLTGDDPAKRTEQLNVIVDESDRLSSLVGSVMELSRVQSGSEKPKPVLFDLAQFCDETKDRYDDVSAKNGYTFEYVGEDGCMVEADPQLVGRALHNLIGNALSHIGDDGYIGLFVRKTGHGTARVEVRDHGPGISEKDLPHLFDRYYRSRADSGKPGTGLGLSITKAIFAASGFTYGVESKVGAGATFWFEAPLYTPPEAQPKQNGRAGKGGKGEKNEAKE